MGLAVNSSHLISDTPFSSEEGLLTVLCFSMGSLPWETVLYKLLPCDSFPWNIVFRNRLLQCESPTPSQILSASLGQHGLLSLHGITGTARSLLQHELPTGSQIPLGTSSCSGVESFTGCIFSPLLISMGCRMACLIMIFTTGCREISAPVHEAPPPPSSLALVFAELFHIFSLFSLAAVAQGFFSPLIKYSITEMLPLSLTGLTSSKEKVSRS